MENINSLWQKVLGKLQISLSSVPYELWFLPIEVLEYRDNKVLVLVAPSTTARNQILKNHFGALADAVKNVFDAETEIEVLDQTDKEAYLAERSQNLSVEVSPDDEDDRHL